MLVRNLVCSDEGEFVSGSASSKKKKKKKKKRGRGNGGAVNPCAVLLFWKACRALVGSREAVTDNREQSDCPLSLVRWSACLLQSAKAIREPRKINKNMVCCLRSRI